MKLSVWIALILLVGVPQGLFAAEDHLNEQQKLGRRLFEQSCGVCHTRPTLISGMYGPELSRLNLGGQEELLRMFISQRHGAHAGLQVYLQSGADRRHRRLHEDSAAGHAGYSDRARTYESPHSGSVMVSPQI